MNACLYKDIVVNSVGLGSREGKKQVRRELPLLFISDVPAELDLNDVRDTLVAAGPRLLNVSIDWNSHHVALELDWPELVRVCWEQGARNITVSWRVFTEESRRITLRLTLPLFAAVENEARLREQSVNRFCVDALEAQVRTRSKRLELLILEDAERNKDSNGRGTTIGDLFNLLRVNLPDCEPFEIVAALKRLARGKYLVLKKWPLGKAITEGRFQKYVLDATGDSEFFYTGDFRYQLTDQGRPYLEGLKGVLPQAKSSGQSAESPRR